MTEQRGLGPIVQRLPVEQEFMVERMRALRDDCGMSSARIGKEVSSSAAAVSRWLSGETFPDRASVLRFAMTCGGDPRVLGGLWDAAAASRSGSTVEDSFAAGRGRGLLAALGTVGRRSRALWVRGVISGAVIVISGLLGGLISAWLDRDPGAGQEAGQDAEVEDGPGSEAVRTVPEGRELRGFAGKCLDVWGPVSANGTPVHLWECTAAPNQRWVLTRRGELRGYEGKCLTVRGPESRVGTPVLIWDCIGSAGQKWVFSHGGELRGFEGRCLEVRGLRAHDAAPTQLGNCEGLPNQKWALSQN